MPVDKIAREQIVQFEIACLWIQKKKLRGKQVMNAFLKNNGGYKSI